MKTLVSSTFVLILFFSIFFATSIRQDRAISQNEIKTLQTLKSEIMTKEEKDDFPTYIKENNLQEPSQFVFDYNPNIDLINEIENYVGWIQIKNTRINYPVVKAKNNDYYLNHNYDLEENIAGAIFMDRRNLANEFDKHTIIYGHYMKNGSMFTDINNYLQEDFFNENKILSFKDLYNDYEYEVISAYYVSADDYILDYEINDEVVNKFISNSLFKTDYQYQNGDRILTLSTCNYILNNGRMIVHAVKK
ncbi:class B sortase [Acidaminobacter sp. JC074]|uniref:class B sortase n=1 Tax=Acidaminobacter sp. JC074 TaxID=2530199 RepID=UPI001F0D7521|nr:class B sortase [Acidaminobacter sp. JC074]MCH4886717.1 class B sortase [Acidaminobacter sp. JC074]